jgi:hypothetical protein
LNDGLVEILLNSVGQEGQRMADQPYYSHSPDDFAEKAIAIRLIGALVELSQSLSTSTMLGDGLFPLGALSE